MSMIEKIIMVSESTIKCKIWSDDTQLVVAAGRSFFNTHPAGCIYEPCLVLYAHPPYILYNTMVYSTMCWFGGNDNVNMPLTKLAGQPGYTLFSLQMAVGHSWRSSCYDLRVGSYIRGLLDLESRVFGFRARRGFLNALFLPGLTCVYQLSLYPQIYKYRDRGW